MTTQKHIPPGREYSLICTNGLYSLALTHWPYVGVLGYIGFTDQQEAIRKSREYVKNVVGVLHVGRAT
jgi:hypothetical protein